MNFKLSSVSFCRHYICLKNNYVFVLNPSAVLFSDYHRINNSTIILNGATYFQRD